MTPSDIADWLDEAEGRCKGDKTFQTTNQMLMSDLPRALAEIRRLQGKNEVLRGLLDDQESYSADLAKALEEAEAERDELRAQLWRK